MKHLQVFNSMSEFEAAKPSMDTPFVVLEKGTPKVIYSNLPEISEDELPIGVVDLGLSVNWASCNIGANSPCEKGLFFQFGRVDGYEFNSNAGTSYEAHDGLIGYYYGLIQSEDITPPTESGKIYNEGDVLDPVDDAAYVATNGKLRMPTGTEMEELLTETTNEWCQCTILGDTHESHNIYGRLFTSKINPNAKIFLPAAGAYGGKFDDENKCIFTDSIGYYWGSTVSDIKNSSNGIYFNSNYCSYYTYITRFGGYSVRGVQDK